MRREFGVEVGAFHVAVVVDVIEVGVGHADFFALVDVGRAAQAVQHARQHGRRGMVVSAVITKAAEGARLIMVVPEKGVPGVSRRHAGLPVADEGFQSGEVEGLQRPFLLVFVVHFEVVEGEDAAEFAALRPGVVDAGGERGRARFADGKAVRVLPEAGAVQFL